MNALPCCIKHAKVPKKVRYVTITVDGHLKLQANANVLLLLDVDFDVDDFMGCSVQCAVCSAGQYAMNGMVCMYGMYVCISVFLFSIQLSMSNAIINGRCKYFVLKLITCSSD